MFEDKKFLNTSANDNLIEDSFYYYGVVVDIDDPIDSKRLRARIKGIDDKISDNKLPWCTSFLPLNIVTNPKVGELVKIFYPSKIDIMNKREWCGPIITTYANLPFQSAITALSNQDISNIVAPKNLKNIPASDGAYMDEKDVGLQGRDNADLIFKPREVLIRAGKFMFNDNTKFNSKNPSYIQLKLSDDGNTSYSSMVGDKICLITYDGAKAYRNILDENILQKIVSSSFSAAYAEPMVDFLKLVQDYVINHIHPQNLPANKGVGKVVEISTFDLSKIIAKNIKIN